MNYEKYKFTLMKPCENCSETGNVSVDTEHRILCPTCYGTGIVEEVKITLNDLKKIMGLIDDGK